MKMNPDSIRFTSVSTELRNKAEELLKEKSSKTRIQLSEAETQKLLHELGVHQIELELQNEELMLAKEQAEIASQRYSELYDFAPSGYFTLSKQGKIVELNLCGAQMLGRERTRLKNSLFGFFVTDETKPVFNLFLKKIFADKARELCEVSLLANGNTPMFVQLTGMVAENEEQCFITAIDITDRKKLEGDKLEASQERYRLLYENAKIGLYRTTPDGTILLANKALVTMLGYQSFDELARRNVEQNGFETPSQRKVFLEKIEQNGEVENLESTWIRQDRTPVFVKESALAIRDTNGKSLYYDGTVEDITKRKHAEEALIESEEKYRALFETSLDGISLLDLSGKIIFANKQVVKLFGYNHPSEFIGLNGFGLIHPDDKPKMDLYFKEFITTGVIANCEVRSVKKDGSEFIGEYSATIIKNANGDPVYMMDVVRDITERKRAEEALRESEARYRLLFEKSADGILIVDVETKTFKYANPALCRMLGYTEEELTTLWLADIHPKQDLQRVIAEFESLTRGDKTLAPDIPCLKKDGGIVYADINSTNITIEGRACNVGLFRDITSRKLVDEALKKSELRFKQISENSQESIWEVDNTGLYTYISPVIKELLGYDVEEIIGLKYFYDLFEPENKEELKQGAFEVFARKESFRNFVNCNIRKDGRKVILSTSGVPMLDNENNLIGYRGVDVDITERKQAEEALIESETRARALIDAIPDLIFRLNKQGIYLDYKAAKEDLAYQAEPIIGKKNRDMMPPEFANLVDEKIKLTLQTRQMQVFEYQLLLPMKGLREYEARMVPCSHDEVIVIVRDVTERKKAEEMINMLAHAVKNSADCIAISDKDYKIIFVNDSFRKVYGFEKEEIVGQKISVITSKNNLPEVGHSLYSALAKKEVWTGEVLNTKKDGNDFPVQLSLAPVITDKGEVIAVVGVLRDITERRHAEAELKLKNEQLLKLNAEKDKFFSIIAHDLRSPFNSFLGFTEMMAEDLGRLTMNEVQEFSRRMRDSALNLFRLLENLLLWAKSQQGSVPFNPQELQLLPVVNESIALLNEPARLKEIVITINIQEDIKVFADKDMLQTIIRNLISNAIKFTPKGGEIDLSATVTHDKIIEMAIHDTGIGMNSIFLENLFNLGFQSNRRGTEGEPSSGLGLLLCKEFVEKHGGKIRVESKEANLPAGLPAACLARLPAGRQGRQDSHGKAGGTSFYFTIPLTI
ncbi:MAG: hypothetical protein A2W85_04565 [Bacteroidetes bacterium GWF2_41_31]|nr:MAG: hypothetical protein A2W85_04565 [Bacteroidetes bacterium GWF2_41_31]